MEKWKALVTRGFPGEGKERLRREFEVDQIPGWRTPSRLELVERMRDVDVILSYSDRFDAQMMDQAPRLKLIACNWGRFAVDADAANARKIKVVSPPASYNWIINSTADIAIGLMITVGRRFRECHEMVLNNEFHHSETSNHFLLSEGLYGRTLGILGAGRIGRAVASRAVPFGLRLIYFDTAPNPEIEALGAKFVSKNTIFKESDYLSVHLSDLDENIHFVGEEQIALMRKTAIFINTSRGRLIDEAALVKALVEKRIAGAGLEVYEHEPDVPKELLGMKNVFLLPHAGGALFKERSDNFSFMVDECLKIKKRYEKK